MIGSVDSPWQLSVIIPHLNEPADLRRCLVALDAQRRDGIPFEIVVIDNGSTERPEAACRGIPDLRLEYETIPGPGPARNLGANLAQAELLAFIDADCVAQPGWIRAIFETMKANPGIDVIGGDIGILMADPAHPSAIESYESIYSYRARVYVERHGYTATGNMAVRRSIFHAVGPFGGIGTMEDTDWGRRATARGHRIVFLPQARVLTPSCKSFAELARRWDRHVAHAFRTVAGRRIARVRWLADCALIVASPLAESIKILRTDRVSGTRNRLLALACLTRIRLHRARRMIELTFRKDAGQFVDGWNRESA